VGIYFHGKTPSISVGTYTAGLSAGP
jgi:hypothetical protein